MRLNKLFLLTAGFVAAGAAAVQAADKEELPTAPMYSIEALDVPESSFEYGPFAVSMGEGENPDTAGLYEQFDFFSFFVYKFISFQLYLSFHLSESCEFFYKSCFFHQFY